MSTATATRDPILRSLLTAGSTGRSGPPISREERALLDLCDCGHARTRHKRGDGPCRGCDSGCGGFQLAASADLSAPSGGVTQGSQGTQVSQGAQGRPGDSPRAKIKNISTSQERSSSPTRPEGDDQVARWAADLDALRRRPPAGPGTLLFKLGRRLRRMFGPVPFSDLMLRLGEIEESQLESGEPAWWCDYATTGRPDRSAVLDELCDLWAEIERGEGESILERASTASKQQPLKARRELNPAGLEDLDAFISLVRAVALQAKKLERPALLPCREIAQVLGVEGQTVSRYRRRLERAGVLTVTAQHSFKERKATEYLVNLDRLRELVEEWPTDEHGNPVTGTASVVFTEDAEEEVGVDAMEIVEHDDEEERRRRAAS